MASTHHGVVYTKKWVVDLILDVAGYVPGTGISDKVIIEPSCGCGAFLTVIAGRLADDAIAVGKGWTSLGNAIRAYDIDSASIETARKAAVEALMTRGCPAIQARELCEQWIVHGDFILDDVPAADFIVGNPPYVRAVEIDRTKRSFYVKRLSSVRELLRPRPRCIEGRRHAVLHLRRPMAAEQVRHVVEIPYGHGLRSRVSRAHARR